MKVAIGYSTYNKAELVRRTIEPVCNGPYSLFWADGSTDDDALALLGSYPGTKFLDVRGGSGAAIVFLLTRMLSHPDEFTHIGLVESDVLLRADWFDETFALFERGERDGLSVGAVSARCYEDRVLSQRDGYAVMHNLGAGMVIFTREAAQIVLDQYRVQWTTENRAIFAQLAGVDIGRYWAFRGSQNFLVADWRWDALLASRGLASLALTPSPVEMIGQNPPLEQQGLTIATGPVENLRSNKVFTLYRDNIAAIRAGDLIMPDSLHYRDGGGTIYIFPHHIASVGGKYEGEWRLKDSPGYGPFAWASWEKASVTIPTFGACDVLVSGGAEGGQVRIVDEQSGYDVTPNMQPEGPQWQVLSIAVPGGVGYRNIKIEALSPGITFYGIRVRDEQPIFPKARFDFSTLPPV